MNNNS